ncbi:hypothetical protein HU200_040656 [Digitaria exilis]|uniref:Uncharacterized protein n=1 Tax=Digitaria exilis TaxID=1010633 RepID=A0A835EHN2_9POAL|nr:hypothetical protein HU200_040656 [Digitaria exilis]
MLSSPTSKPIVLGIVDRSSKTRFLSPAESPKYVDAFSAGISQSELLDTESDRLSQGVRPVVIGGQTACRQRHRKSLRSSPREGPRGQTACDRQLDRLAHCQIGYRAQPTGCPSLIGFKPFVFVNNRNVSHRYLPVSFNQVVGATTPFFTAVLAYGVAASREAYATYAVLVPVVAIATGGVQDYHQKRRTSMDLLQYMALVAIALLREEFGVVVILEREDPNFIWILLCNSSMAYFVNLTNFLVTKHTSPLTLQVRPSWHDDAFRSVVVPCIASSSEEPPSDKIVPAVLLHHEQSNTTRGDGSKLCVTVNCTFMREEVNAPSMAYNDYIIIGAVTVGARCGSRYEDARVLSMVHFSDVLVDTSPSSPSNRGRGCWAAAAASTTGYVRAVEWESWEVADVMPFRPALGTWQAAVTRGLLETGVLPDNEFTYDHIHGTMSV